MDKICRRCEVSKPESAYRAKQRICKACRKKQDYNKLRNDRPEQYLWAAAKNRARVKGVEFTLKIEDVVIPTYCPYFGAELVQASGSMSPNSPSIDRKDNSKGYTKENCEVISMRANKMKGAYSLAQLRRFALAVLERT